MNQLRHCDISDIKQTHRDHGIAETMHDLQKTILCFFKKMTRACENRKQQRRAQENAEQRFIGINTCRDTKQEFQQINDEYSELVSRKHRNSSVCQEKADPDADEAYDKQVDNGC
jgi:hypothetical protein